MNKKIIFLLLAASFFSIVTSAQITIDQNDFVTVGHDVERVDDTMPDPSILLGGTGAQTWDFSLLNNHYTYAIPYVDPTSAPYASEFPGATICSEQNSFYSYYIKNSSGIVGLGSHVDFTYSTTPISINLKNSPADTVISFPATYSSNYTSNYTTTGKAPVVYLGSDSAKVKSVVSKTVTYDAYGLMTTPLGTFNTIRAKKVVVSTDSLWLGFKIFTYHTWQLVQNAKDTTTTYKWYAKGLGAELVSANYNDSIGKLDYVSWMFSLSAGINDINYAHLSKAFPSPANDIVYIENTNTKAKEVVIMDINGERLISHQLNDKVTTVPVNELPAGFYLYSIFDGSNIMVDYGKIIIAH